MCILYRSKVRLEANLKVYIHRRTEFPATLTRLESSYPAGVISPAFDPNTYHPALRPLYDHFLTTLYNICSPFTTDPDELQYIAAARWPGFVQPVLDEYQRYVTQLRDERRTARTAEFGGQPDEGDGEDQEQEDDADIPEISPPTEDTRMRLIRMFTPSFTSALEALYPRLTSASEWANTNKPPPNLLSEHPRYVSSLVSVQPLSTIPGQGLGSLPRIAKFILIASFLASTNPAKSDLRMFGRGLDERSKRKRRKAGTPRKTSSKSTAIKVGLHP